MALDKLVDSTQLDADLASVADAIRTKGGTSAQLAFPEGFVSAIDVIPTGGGARTLQKLVEATVSEPVSEIRLTLPTGTEEQCDAVIVLFNGLTMSSNDWLYLYANNNTRPGAGNYLTQSTTVNGYVDIAFLRPFRQTDRLFWAAAGDVMASGAIKNLEVGETVSSILFRPYAAATQITGGAISIWGYVQ